MPQYGMNIDPNNHAAGTPGNVSSFRGLQWVRIVFNAEAEPLRSLNIDQLCQHYAQVADTYLNEGIGALFVLNNQMLRFDNRWATGSDWPGYCRDFAAQSGKIAAAFKSRDTRRNIAYEMWNEEDGGQTLIDGSKFMDLLVPACAAIKQSDPNATRVFGGLFQDAPGYLHACAAQGRLPVEAIGVHPYTRFIVNPGGLDTDLRKLWAAHGRLPLWITEFNDGNINPETNARVEQAFRNYDLLLRTKLKDVVKVAIWYGWSDGMNPGFGLVDGGGSPKQNLYDTFFRTVQHLPAPVPPTPAPLPLPPTPANPNLDPAPVPPMPADPTPDPVPVPPAPATIANQAISDAFSSAASATGTTLFALMGAAGLGHLGKMMTQAESLEPYSGPAIDELPGLTDQQKTLIKKTLGLA